MSKPTFLTVVVPVFNEKATAREAVERLLKVQLQLPLEVVVVDDGSTDGSAEIFGDLENAGRIRVFRHEKNLGKGAAIRTGINAAEGDLLTIMDADLEYDPEDFGPLLTPILEGETGVVYGTRTFGSHTAFSFWYVLGNRFVNLWASFLFDTWLTDVETCFKMAETRIWRSLSLRQDGFGIEAEVTGKILRAGHTIFEVPIKYKARRREEGKKLNWTDGVEALFVLLRIRLGL